MKQTLGHCVYFAVFNIRGIRTYHFCIFTIFKFLRVTSSIHYDHIYLMAHAYYTKNLATPSRIHHAVDKYFTNVKLLPQTPKINTAIRVMDTWQALQCTATRKMETRLYPIWYNFYSVRLGTTKGFKAGEFCYQTAIFNNVSCNLHMDINQHGLAEIGAWRSNCIHFWYTWCNRSFMS